MTPFLLDEALVAMQTNRRGVVFTGSSHRTAHLTRTQGETTWKLFPDSVDGGRALPGLVEQFISLIPI